MWNGPFEQVTRLSITFFGGGDRLSWRRGSISDGRQVVWQ